MKASVVNPYLDSLGGGERYSMSFAQVLSEMGFAVDVQWNDELIIEKLRKRFGLKLKNIRIVSDVKRGDGYDVCFWLSDGSIPLLRSRNNILHFQFPFKEVAGSSLINKMKLFRIKHVVCNSFFTKGFIDKEFKVESTVIYPPVDTASFRPSRKKKDIIFYVGRFSLLTQNKAQGELVDAFIKFHKRYGTSFRLVLAGGVEVGSKKFLSELKKKADGYPVTFLESPDFSEIINLYKESKIFWSASGYGVDPVSEPMRVEHFGISTVEAMSSGSIPFCFDAGGNSEIIKDGKTGFLWKRESELIEKTMMIITDKKLYNRVSRAARKESERYSYEEFSKKVAKLLG